MWSCVGAGAVRGAWWLYVFKKMATVAMAQWLWLTAAVGVAAAAAVGITDEQYFSMPQMYQMDDYDACLSSQRGVFCLGSFELVAEGLDHGKQLLLLMQSYSQDKNNFNHTVLHRGFCITSRCAHIDENNSDFKERFLQCVDHQAKEYGLTARLTKLDYCRTAGQQQRPLDVLDVGFAYCVGFIVLVNVLATAYDVLRSADSKPNPYIQAWSLVANWRRLTIDNATEKGDPKLTALKPILGLKVICMLLMILGHALFMEYKTYMYNPQFFEAMHRNAMTIIFMNGTVIVQTFFLMSSFLLTYNLLRLESSSEGNKLGFHMLPFYLIHRAIRLLPVLMFTVGLVATWWARMGSGPLWAPLVEAEEAHCRSRGWAQALFINNYFKTEDLCLLHTWYVAVDMQLYVISSILVIALVLWWRQSALKILASLLLLSILGNFIIAYYWNLKAVVSFALPKLIQAGYAREPSFNWMYKTPWGSLPATLLGIALAFFIHQVQSTGYKVQDHMCIRMLYHVSIPSMFAWIFSGFWMKELTSPLGQAVYAALERPVFALLMCIALFGIITNIGYQWNKFLSWVGWQVLGRMSLSVYLVHWAFHITQIAGRPHLVYISWTEVAANWLVTLFASYVSALPVYLLVELPVQKFMDSLLFKKS